MPLLDGTNIFGRSVTSTTSSNPRSTQKTGFAGINGVDLLDLGRHGTYSEIRGIYFGVDAPSLNAEIIFARSYDDGRLYSYQDQYGNIYPYVKIDSFELTGRVLQDQRGLYQQYQMRLMHAY